MELNIKYDIMLFDVVFIFVMFDYFVYVIEQVMLNFFQFLKEYFLLFEVEEQMIFKIWNVIDKMYLYICFYELFEQQVKKIFDRVVVSYED